MIGRNSQYFAFVSSHVLHDRPDRFSLVHQVKCLVDARERQLVGDQAVDIDLLLHVPVDDLGNVGTPSCAAKRGALPYAARDQLERSSLDFLTRTGDSDDNADSPATVTALESLSHQ